MPRIASLAALVLLPLLAGHAWPQGGTRRVSLGHQGQEAQGDSVTPALDFSGRRVAFASSAPNLVPGDGTSLRDVFVHDLVTGELVRASVDLAGGDPDADSREPALSDDGARVAFESLAGDLVVGDTNGAFDVYLRDLTAGVTERVSLAHDGDEPDGHSWAPSLSADARRVAFESEASNLVAVFDGNNESDVFVRDLDQGWIRRVSVAFDGSHGDGPSRAASLSADGRFVAFQSESSVVVPGDANGAQDVFVHDLETGQTQLVSLARDGAQANDDCWQPALTADGSKVIFASRASNLVPGDTNGETDVFLRDLQAGTVELVSAPVGGGFASGDSVQPSISRDGRYQLFRSFADDLIPGDTNGVADLFLRDAWTGSLERVNLTSLDQPMSNTVWWPALSADGRAVAFHASDPTVVPFDLNGDFDVYVRELSGAAPTVASYCTPSATSVAGCEAVLEGSGAPSLAAAGGFELTSGPVPGAAFGLLRVGVRGPAAVPLGTLGGLDCVDAPNLAVSGARTGGTAGACDGALAFTLADLAAAHPATVLPGATVHTQLWLRDPANPDGFALSSAVWFQVLP